MFDADDDDPKSMPPHWAWHAWKQAMSAGAPQRSPVPTFEDYRRAGLVRGNGYEFGGADEDEKPILSPVVAVGLAGLALLWISRRNLPKAP